jgi:hypothetical protein
MVKVVIEDLGVTISRWLVKDRDRHKNVRFYFRRKGQEKIRLYTKPGTRAFWEEWQAACNGDHEVQSGIVKAEAASRNPRHNPPKGTLAWLFNEYARSNAFKDLGDTTQERRQKVMSDIAAEPTSQDDPAPVGYCPLPAGVPRR